MLCHNVVILSNNNLQSIAEDLFPDDAMNADYIITVYLFFVKLNRIPILMLILGFMFRIVCKVNLLR